jgi:hypothetical protein
MMGDQKSGMTQMSGMMHDMADTMMEMSGEMGKGGMNAARLLSLFVIPAAYQL